MDPNLKNCPFCDEEIRFNAVKCKHCGEFLDEDLHRESIEERQAIAYPVRKWHPGIAALLSLLIPGAGQIYKGNIGSGIGWLIFVPLGYLFFIVPGAILHLICILTATSGNPYPVEKTRTKEPEDSSGVHPAIFIVVAAIVIAILYALS